MHVRRLLILANRHGVNVYLRPGSAGTCLQVRLSLALARIEELVRAQAQAVTTQLHALIRIGFERTLEQDPGLGMRQLVDVACKTLSPAVNDPYTAIQAIHHLSVLYTELGKRRVGTIVANEPGGPVPARSLAAPIVLAVIIARGRARARLVCPPLGLRRCLSDIVV